MHSAVLKVLISFFLFILIVASFLAWFIAQIPNDPSIPAGKGSLEITPAEAALDPTIYSVPFCDMLNNPTRYHRKLVRTQAIFINDVDWAYIRNEGCPNEDGVVRAVGALESNDMLIESKSRDQIGRIIDTLLKQDTFSLEVNADMVGRFYAGSKTGRGNEFAILYEFSVSPTGKRP
jgi:hypothetical protein